MKKLRNWLKYFLLVFLLFYMLPFSLLLIGKPNIENLTFASIANQTSADSDSSTVVKSFFFVTQHLRRPNKEGQSEDKSPFEVLVSGRGFCDQQAMVLNRLLKFHGIESQLLMLRGKFKVSHHTILEVKINNQSYLIDPYFKKILLRKNKKPFTFDDLQKKQNGANELLKIHPDYLLWFSPENAPKKFIPDETSFYEQCKQLYFSGWIKCFGKSATYPYLFLANEEKNIRQFIPH